MTEAKTFVDPTPIELPSPGLAIRSVRAARTVAAFARYLGPTLRRRDPAQIARGLRRSFESLGATYVKFGQLVGSSPGAFGQVAADEFRSCLDQGPAVPYREVRALVESELGEPLDTLFESFEETPLAAASIAVVHRARLRDGRDVAVKVLRPRVERLVAKDLDIMEPLFRRLALQGIPVAGPLFRFLNGFRRQVACELDLLNEAATMRHFRRLYAEAELSSIVVPEPIEGLEARRVLVMELLDGVPIDDPARIAQLGHDPRPLLQGLLRSWFLTGLRDGLFHGDIHAGNLMLLRDGRLGMVDWGIVGVLDDRTRHIFRRFVQGVLGDDSGWADVQAFVRELMPTEGDGDDAVRPPGMQDDDNDPQEFGRIRTMLTSPFGEVNLTGAFRGPGAPRDGRKLTRPERVDRRRRIKRWRRHALGTGLFEHAALQADFLLFKQLLYFERYGKMYLADVALLGEREFLTEVLAMERST